MHVSSKHTPCTDHLLPTLNHVGFTGYVFGQGYHELGSNAHIFVQTSAVGGTHPALLEAMAFGNCVVVHNTMENLETIGQADFACNGRVGGASLRGAGAPAVGSRVGGGVFPPGTTPGSGPVQLGSRY